MKLNERAFLSQQEYWKVDFDLCNLTCWLKAKDREILTFEEFHEYRCQQIALSLMVDLYASD